MMAIYAVTSTDCHPCRINSARSHKAIQIQTSHFVINITPAMGILGLIESLYKVDYIYHHFGR